jgi:hypothetical protein
MRGLAIPASHLFDRARFPQYSSSRLFELSGHKGDLGRLQLISPYASLFGLRAVPRSINSVITASGGFFSQSRVPVDCAEIPRPSFSLRYTQPTNRSCLDPLRLGIQARHHPEVSSGTPMMLWMTPVQGYTDHTALRSGALRRTAQPPRTLRLEK